MKVCIGSRAAPQTGVYRRSVPLTTNIHLPAAAAGAHKPIAPIGYGHLGAVSLRHLAGVGLNLAIALPDHTINLTPALAAFSSVIGGPL